MQFSKILPKREAGDVVFKDELAPGQPFLCFGFHMECQLRIIGGQLRAAKWKNGIAKLSDVSCRVIRSRWRFRPICHA